jgi:membrane dipeptidase
MNRLGMAIDLSHTGDVTCLDTISTSQKPVFISHSGARGVWNSKRMKPDEVIKACAQKGGVIGIEASPLTTFSRGRPEMDIESVMDHFTYCVELVGLEHVCFGLDVLYGDHVGLHEVLGGHMAMSQVIFDIDSGEVPEKVAYVKGLENPTEGYNNIVRWLVKHDYSDDEIRKVVGGNVLRALQEVWD